jgi:hypothetical protein
MGNLSICDAYEKAAKEQERKNGVTEVDIEDNDEDEVRPLLGTQEALNYLSLRIQAFKGLTHYQRVNIPTVRDAVARLVDEHQGVQDNTSGWTLVLHVTYNHNNHNNTYNHNNTNNPNNPK